MKNKLTDLNDILFAQLERLTDEGLKPEAVAGEIKRAEAVVQVADTIVENARLQLAAYKLATDNENGAAKTKLPPTLAITSGVHAA